MKIVEKVSGNKVERFSGVHPGGWGYLLGKWAIEDRDRHVVAVCGGAREQERLIENLMSAMQILGDEKSNREESAQYYPSWEVLPHENRLPHSDVISDRLSVLMNSIDKSSTKPIVASVQAILQKTFRPEWLKDQVREIKVGDELDPLDLIEWLEEEGYQSEVQVSGKGQIAMRGGIIDVFPVSQAWPVRIEFFGDEVESIRSFDPLNQLSRETLEQVSISPGGELGVMKQMWVQDEESLDHHCGCFAEYFPKETLWVFCDREAILDQVEEISSQVPEGDPYFLSLDAFEEELEKAGHKVIYLDEAPMAERYEDSVLEIQSLDQWAIRSGREEDVQVMETRRHDLFEQLSRWIRMDFDVRVFCSNEGEKRRVQELWDEILPEDDSRRPPMYEMAYNPGFLDLEARVVWITDAEIFGRAKIQRPRKLRSRHVNASRSALEIDFTDLQEGDLVVHLQYGIGRFTGIVMMDDRNENSQECLCLEFASSGSDQPDARLYVPVTEAHLVSKYVGAGKVRPPLNTLGGTRWKKTREKAEKAVEDLAAEFLRIQAIRESSGGHAFTEDKPWQREFESAFPYQETEDQLKAIDETKADMEMPKPMDRLICGDVGYGKTEVAIRAAFKSVLDGKQVALLVPTTVLCQQHLNNFKDRMAAYPISIESLSRFQSKKNQRSVLEKLKMGGVDILIGTHRLLQKDVEFKDLGLVIIDEEQRFGVLHKERFKRMRATVDVLTLSATPIPRTLYLSLTGARDMSTIETPPQDRLPVETVVHPYDERVIRDAIQRELNRQGQVFFLHNRVGTIYTMESKLKELLPKARIIVGHGQMSSDELEKVMSKFVNGEADVLLSTTIIESGIDIPNANTIIIDRADRFGLSQLYQLRGRVGRYKNQAYAYLLLPGHMRLLTDVRRRMSAIKQYSSLGSGFKIAMRDLEIRGSGNLLGSEQSGHITAVGFELYCQLLKQSVSRMKGEKVEKRVDVTILIDFLELNPHSTTKAAANLKKSNPSGDPIASACLPYNYIEDTRHRVDIYRKLAQLASMEDLQSLKKELEDRFGKLPKPVELLFLVSEIKILSASRLITRIECEDRKVKITRNNELVSLGGRFPRLTKKAPEARMKEIRRLVQSF